jgi:alkanesulfonate monooxygenase SsuD/methylene tetrahydromethanopterin reductase-like flavin-dependent oxidoreductase (luciferase family)
LIALAAAAAVTERVELVTDILIAPLRSSTALFAKQAATLDSLSGGRLTLGLAPGGRRDDFEASGVDFSRRGRIFEQQLEEATAVWRGERGIGPAPGHDGRPGLLIGGSTDTAFQRAARYADGWTMGGGPPAMVTQALGKLTAAWRAAGRAGTPRTMALFYFALGPDAEKLASESLGDYYAFLGDYAEQVVAGAAKDADTVKQYLGGFEEAGTDDVICFPVSADLSQVDRLAEVALS